jgi:hypothetical protein
MMFGVWPGDSKVCPDGGAILRGTRQRESVALLALHEHPRISADRSHVKKFWACIQTDSFLLKSCWRVL